MMVVVADNLLRETCPYLLLFLHQAVSTHYHYYEAETHFFSVLDWY